MKFLYIERNDLYEKQVHYGTSSEKFLGYNKYFFHVQHEWGQFSQGFIKI